MNITCKECLFSIWEADAFFVCSEDEAHRLIQWGFLLSQNMELRLG